MLLLVPVKSLARAKTRLGGVDAAGRRALVRGFALDALAAAVASSAVDRVCLVTDDDELVRDASATGVSAIPDEGAGDLNTALRQAASAVAGYDGPVAALCADLPCLVASDLTVALRELGSRPEGGFVADHTGTGTTLLLAPSAGALEPRFGLGSRRAHEGLGLHDVTAAVPTLRLDVDTAADLRAAIALGVGPVTAAALPRNH